MTLRAVGAGALLTRYVPGPTIDDPIAQVTAAGAKTFFHENKQGSVIAMSGNSAALAEGPYTYDPYGNCVAGGAACSSGEPYRFTGRRFDPETGLSYYRARYYSPTLGRFLQTDPVGYSADLDLYTYVGNEPVDETDPSGKCADHYDNGTCKVNVDPSTGKEGTAAGKQLEAVLNKYDKAINALSDKGKYNIKDSNGKVIGSMTGKEIKAIWNGTHFTVTNKFFNNGGAGGGTGGTWHGDLFSGNSELNSGAVSAYANAASSRNEAPIVGTSTLTFHELGHETHFGESLTANYPVTPTISWPREWGASSAGDAMAGSVGAPFDCSIPGGCQ